MTVKNIGGLGVSLFALALLLAPEAARTAGSGGGGGTVVTPPPVACTADTWSCTSFGECSAEGRKTRVCTMTDNCPTAETPKPSESEACTPPAKPLETPKPTTTTSPVADKCTADEFDCTEFAQCGENGKQVRKCVMKKDCAGVTTPKPEEERVCPGLRCGQLDTLEKRVSCRLKLSESELASEFKLLYYPEYCKTGKTDDWKKGCIALYQSFGKCWKMPVGEKRVGCAKEVLSIGDLNKEKDACIGKKGTEKTACVEAMTKKVKNFVLFNLYELSQKAETLLKQGKATTEQVAAFDVYIETKKQELQTKNTVADWKRIAGEVKAKWAEFVKNVKK
ncbi:MAG: hypothetical protein G01um101418_224 [Parcubacteria group bacterium Gr01-1014_18]|nr:MAG: hypothetical protein Greene041636_192 [Parcubacteria group bacterium Greene0416_36]TSC81384.1 MAG: hypothetical protein G01um101418_224 [Parcubacteria group bacterium Gr01-1014_18]TSC99430.1 MAG: hypothetical protein Greene101420_97 [Parcubacteria group bacterium Greene1014_20]TSD07651.1 MAG: hypothetical protein Greene07142_108 [Parcubacteria group bacterium Greene0714_2]